MPTPAFAQFLQMLWASVQGTGGLIDITTQNIFEESPSFSPDTSAGREPILAEMPESKAVPQDKTWFLAERSYTDLYKRVSNAEMLAALGSVSSSKVSDIKGTANQVIVSTAAGVYTLSTPQDIGTSSNVQFGLVDPTDIVGTVTNDNAAAGNVGETTKTTVLSGAPVSLTTATAVNVTSISLTVGDWEVCGTVFLQGAAATVATRAQASISQTSATLVTAGTEGFGETLAAATATFSASNMGIPVTSTRVSINATTTVYLVAQLNFSGGTASAFGFIKARRVR